MKRSAFDEKMDQRTADDAGTPQALMCHAHGCPNRWSVDAGKGRCCSAHAWADQNRWPEITQQQWDETERARLAGEDKPLRYVEPLTKRAKRDRGERLSAAQEHALAEVRKPAAIAIEEEAA